MTTSASLQNFNALGLLPFESCLVAMFLQGSIYKTGKNLQTSGVHFENETYCS
jgi:hypothetical protein